MGHGGTMISIIPARRLSNRNWSRELGGVCVERDPGNAALPVDGVGDSLRFGLRGFPGAGPWCAAPPSRSRISARILDISSKRRVPFRRMSSMLRATGRGCSPAPVLVFD